MLEAKRGLFDTMVADELELEQRKPTAADLAKRFVAAVRESRAFTWIGATSGEDANQRIVVDFYLGTRSKSTDSIGFVVVDAFNELALSLEPHIVAYLHTGLKGEQLRNQILREFDEDCIDSCSSGQPRTLIWDQLL